MKGRRRNDLTFHQDFAVSLAPDGWGRMRDANRWSLVGYLPAILVPAIVAMGTVVVYSRILTPAEYGHFAIAMTAVNIALALASRWLMIGVTRLLPAAREAAAEAHFIATTLACSMAMLVLAVAGVACVFAWRRSAGLPMGGDLRLSLLGMAIFAARSLVVMANAMRRARLEVTRYAVVECGQALAGFGGSLLAVRLCGASADSVLAGTAAGYAAITLVELAALLPWLRTGRPDRAILRQLVGFSGPLTATAALSLMLLGSERALLQGFLGASAVGLYSAVASIADRTIALMFSGITMAVFPLAVRALETEGAAACRRQQRWNIGVVTALALPTAVGVAITAPQLVALLLGPEFRAQGTALLPWLAASTFIARMAIDVFDHAFYLSRRTMLLFATLGPALTFSIACNFFAIPQIGLFGAAYVGVATSVLLLVLSAGIGARVMPVPLPIDAMVRAALATAGMALAVLALPRGEGTWILLRQVACGVAAYGAIGLALNLLGARGWLRRWLMTRFKTAFI
jgi:O-antigen/teichoic acid export membrane protein